MIARSTYFSRRLSVAVALVALSLASPQGRCLAQSPPAAPLGAPPEEGSQALLARDSGFLLRQFEFELDVTGSYGFRELGSRTRAVVDPDVHDGRRLREFALRGSLRVGLFDRLELAGDVDLRSVAIERIEDDETTRESDAGPGDVGAGIRLHVLRERPWVPDVIAFGRFRAPTGSSPYDVDDDELPLGSGHWAAGGGFALVKTYDPLALFVSLEYLHTFREFVDDLEVEPGGLFSYTLGAALAVNDAVAVGVQLRGGYSGETYVEDVEIPGTNQEPASLRLGLTAHPSAHVWFEPAVEIGLTGDAPDFVLSLGIALKF